MLYSKLAGFYESLENTSSRLKKVEIISGALRDSKNNELPMITLLLRGKVFPSYSEEEVGIAGKTAIKMISISTGFPGREIVAHFNRTGDLGLTCEHFMKKRRQQTLASRPLTVGRVFESFRKIASVEGKGSQEVKKSMVKELITSASPEESRYIVRTAINELRVGVAEGVLRDSIAGAFLDTETQEKKKESVSAVEWAWFLNPDYGEIARIAKRGGVSALREVRIQVGKPYHVLLAEKSGGLKDALEKFEKPALEFKYDGARIVIHKKGEKLWFYTRRLENVTRQFPELQDFVRKSVKAGECVLEGEMLGFDSKTGRPAPFQSLSQRIRRKYDIEKMVQEIPIQVNLFDIVYLEGKELFKRKLSERWARLNDIIKPMKGKFQFAEHIETRDLERAEKFYRRALEASQEGLIVKNLEAIYQPGRRVAGGWLKVKPIMETLDLAITGAIWGTGKRAEWFGSFVLSCRHGDGFLECGMMGTGIKEKASEKDDITFGDLTEMLKPLIKSKEGNRVELEPKVVAEVAYEEIQKSPNYSSGYALRFPRLVRLRSLDKGPEEADDLKRLERLYGMQKGKRSRSG